MKRGFRDVLAPAAPPRGRGARRPAPRRGGAPLLAVLVAFLLPSPLGSQEKPPDRAALARELPRIPPRSPAEALGAFRLRDGFRIELVAAEPEVIDPVALAFDAEGRMLVVEMRDYPFEPGGGQSREQDARAHPGRVRLLEDADGDGRAERSTVFADGLSWPTGILPWRGGAFVTAAPDILYLRDEDGDGAADRREVAWTGFSRENVQGLLNNLCWGLDNRIHGSSGSNGGAVGRPGRSGGEGLSLRGRDFRFDPRGGALEPLPGGGQFGMCFDDWGDRFACTNSDHIRHVVIDGGVSGAVTDIAADGAAAPVFRASLPEPWRVVRTRWRTASSERGRYAPTELVPAGFFTSATGIHVYRGAGFPAEYRGNVFIGDVGGNLVHRKVLERRGASFTARRDPTEAASEFLVSTDNWFRPVAFAEGPDGALYVLDMYRETIEHPASLPDLIKELLDLKSGDDRGRIWRIVPAGGLPAAAGAAKPARAPDLELVRRLEDRGAWWRETAQRLLVERFSLAPGGGGAPPAADAPRAAVVEALAALARAAASPEARLHSLWTLDGHGALGAADLERGLADEHAGVRRSAVRLAAARLAAKGTREEPDLRRRLLDLAGDPDPRVRLELALTLGGLEGDDAARALARLARTSLDDPWLRSAILSPAANLQRAAALLEGLFADGGVQIGAGRAAFVLDLAALVGGRNDRGEVARALELAARAAGQGHGRAAGAIVAGLGEGLRREGVSLRALLASPPGEIAPSAPAVERLLREALARAADGAAAEDERLEAIRLLASAPDAVAEESLGALLDAREPRAVQLAGVRALAASSAAGIGPLLVSRWRELSPPVRREAAEALFGRRERLPALLDGLERGDVSPSELDLARRRALVENKDAALRARARALLAGAGASTPESRRQALEAARGALDLAGDPRRGRDVFRRVCATCHRLAGEGHLVAPDFATLRERTPESILEHTLDPNREVLPEYLSYAAVTRDGRVLTGIIASETEISITLRRAEGVEEVVSRSELARLESSGVSLMPEGLEKDLTPQDLADIIAAIRAEAPEKAGK